MTVDAPFGRPRRTRRRRSRLAQPRTQLRCALRGLLWAAPAALLQVAWATDGASSRLTVALVLTGLACAASALAASQRFAGPLTRFERYFERLARGEDPGPCRLRQGDGGERLCTLVNQVVAPWRGVAPPQTPGEEASADEDTPRREKVRTTA